MVDMDMALKQQILAFLSTKQGTVPTLTVAKACCGKRAAKKYVNPALYSLARENKVVKECGENGKNPRWRLATTTTTTSSSPDTSIFAELVANCVDASLEDRGEKAKTRSLSVIVRFPDKATLDYTTDTLGGDDWIASFEAGLDEIGKSTWRIDDVIEVNKFISQEEAELFGCVDYIQKT